LPWTVDLTASTLPCHDAARQRRNSARIAGDTGFPGPLVLGLLDTDRATLPLHRLFRRPVFAAAALAVACGSGKPPGAAPARPGAVADASAPTDAPAEAQTENGNADAASLAFQADTPSVYVAKVKNVLLGLPPTDDEVKAVVADATQLTTLIDGWMGLPQYAQKMMTFFELAFQQTQVSVIDFADQTFPRPAAINGTTAPLLIQNARESFARTVLELNSEGRPLSEAMTTQRFMMTPALMEFYAFLDVWQVDNAGKVNDSFKKANPKLTLSVEAAQGPIAIADTLNPASPNYMHWYDPDVVNAGKLVPGCAEDPIVYPAAADTLHYILLGSLLTRKSTTTGALCPQVGGTALAPQLTTADFNTWKMVTIRPPASGESPTAFYDLATFRSSASAELVLSVPRLGFFSTPAFFANWPTNTSNQMRVTMNQALIVATGAAVDGTDVTQPTSTPGLDSAHATTPACLYCHRTLDPTRSIFAATYSWNYHDQIDPTFRGQNGIFAFRGLVRTMGSLADLGGALASHPLLPQAWVQKLCYYVNSSPCDTSDPEFQRVVGVFQSSNLSWNVLVRELLSSPLTTNAAPTQTTTATGEVVAVSRRDHFCAALNNRLGLSDVCGLDALTKAMARTSIPEIVSGLPSDGYGRGAIAPVLPNAPSLFYRSGTENICESISALVVDPGAASSAPNAKRWSSTLPDAAIADFVQILMGLTPSDSRAAPAQSLLKSHFASARQTGASATDALRSTFVVACMAPSAISIGL
jgi:hypothetical protein